MVGGIMTITNFEAHKNKQAQLRIEVAQLKESNFMKNEPIKNFISFKETQTILGHEWRRSVENAIENGSLRLHTISPECGKYRAIYLPDVMKLKRANDKKKLKRAQDKKLKE